MHSFDRQRYSVENFETVFDRAAAGTVEGGNVTDGTVDGATDAPAAQAEAAGASVVATPTGCGLVEDVDFDTAIAEVLLSLASGAPTAGAEPAPPVIDAAEAGPEAGPETLAEVIIELAPIPAVVIDTDAPPDIAPEPEVFATPVAAVVPEPALAAAKVEGMEAEGVDEPVDEDDDDLTDEDIARAADAATFRLLGELERLWQAAA